METVIAAAVHRLASAGTNFVMNRFTGPGRVALQSMYVHWPDGEGKGTGGGSPLGGALGILGALAGE